MLHYSRRPSPIIPEDLSSPCTPILGLDRDNLSAMTEPTVNTLFADVVRYGEPLVYGNNPYTNNEYSLWSAYYGLSTSKKLPVGRPIGKALTFQGEGLRAGMSMIGELPVQAVDSYMTPCDIYAMATVFSPGNYHAPMHEITIDGLSLRYAFYGGGRVELTGGARAPKDDTGESLLLHAWDVMALDDLGSPPQTGEQVYIQSQVGPGQVQAIARLLRNYCE